MKKIELRPGIFAEVDDEDYENIRYRNWKLSISNSRLYAREFKKNPHTKKIESIMLQTLIVGHAPKGFRLSFKDGNSLNCQRNNLEFINNSIAGHRYYKKKKPSRNAKNNFKGILIQYIARIKFKNKIIVLGSFNTEEEAAYAYNIKAAELFGRNAVLNNFC